MDAIVAERPAELADFHDQGASTATFRAEVLAGLAAPQKTLPCKYLYDRRGSLLFDLITELDEYYPTRTEAGILAARAGEIAAIAGPGASLVEFGSGSSVKTRALLDALDRAAAYVPIDISRGHLLDAAGRIAADYPGLAVVPVAADYTRALDLDGAIPAGPRLGFFPGSTIGNFARREAVDFLARAAAALGPGAGLVIGVDLKKPLDILVPAYDDALGVTGAFNLNLLARINRELDADFDLRAFTHEARYNAAAGRIEMHLVAREPQTVTITGPGAGASFDFAAGETIHTENSHKFGVAEFGALAAEAGWRVVEVWTDGAELFSVQYLVVA